MNSRSQPAKRKRGIILSPEGWQRVQAAEQSAIDQNNYGKPYTLQELSECTGLSPNTLARVRSCKVAVDQQTLENYFRAFDLALRTEDYTDSDAAAVSNRQQALLSGQLPVDSPFYILRPPIETLCGDALLQPGALVRIKAPRQMGKTSLAARLLFNLRQQGCVTTMASLQLADSAVLSDLQRFLQWFCAIVSQNLELPNQIDQAWDDLFGSNYNCTNYFETHILTGLERPLVLILDEVDAVFDYPEIATDFFGMLRAWYEKARYGDGKSDLWKKLRIVLIHSTEVYLPLNLHQSPFNAGLAIELPLFTQAQVLDLAHRYGVGDPGRCASELITLTAGNPYLVQIGLYHLSVRTSSLDILVRDAYSTEGIYGAHLRHLLWNLQQYPELLVTLKQVVTSGVPIEIEPFQALKLQSKGLVRFQDQQVFPSCPLYRKYFQQVLTSS